MLWFRSATNGIPQFAAKIYVVETIKNEDKQQEETARKMEKPAVVLALRGSLSRYVKELELAPGWRRLANGIAAYSDPVATALVDPRGQIEETWKSRMTLVKDGDGLWTQMENVEDYAGLGSQAYRKIGLGGPQRTITFFAASKMEDYWEQDSEVPVRPLPEEKMREVQGRTDWPEDDYENEDELELQVDARDIEKMVVAEKRDEVELDETLHTEKMTVKEFQLACKERQLPYSGSKRRLLDRLIAFKVNLENQMKLSIASKLFEEQERRPTGEDVRGDEGPVDKVKERSDQFGTCLVMAALETKAVHVAPVPTKGTASLKTVTEVIRFSLKNSSIDPVVFQGGPERGPLDKYSGLCNRSGQ